ncbi:MAG: hypothetical protein ACYDDF_11465 [Thermoplasmatota archaeon]
MDTSGQFPIGLQDGLRIALVILAAGIFLIAALAFRRRPTTRTLLVTVAFLVYVLKELFLASDLVFSEQTNLTDNLRLLADAAFLLLIAAAFLKG